MIKVAEIWVADPPAGTEETACESCTVAHGYLAKAGYRSVTYFASEIPAHHHRDEVRAALAMNDNKLPVIWMDGAWHRFSGGSFEKLFLSGDD